MSESRVYNMDCIKYMRTLPDKFFDLAVADPPYGDANRENIELRNERGRFKKNDSVGRTGGTWAAKYGTTIKKWDFAPPQEFFDELFRVSKNVIIWGGNYFSLPPTRCFLVWKKLTISEQFTMAMCEYAWTSFNRNAKLFECAPQGKPGDPRIHPTQKPLELYAWVFKNFTNGGGDRIFDPMMGSQSSRIAAYKLGIDYVGCELDKEYFEKGCQRFEKECKGIESVGGQKIIQPSLF